MSDSSATAQSFRDSLSNRFLGLLPVGGFRDGCQVFLLHIAVLLTGAIFMIFEITANRLIAPYFGSDIYTLGNILGCFLSGLFVGNLVGGRLSEHDPERRFIGLFLLLSGFWLTSLPLLTPATCRFVHRLHFPFPWSCLLAASLLFFIPCTMMGTITPFAIKWNPTSEKRPGMSAGFIGSLSALGSLCGCFLTTFVILAQLGFGTVKTLIVSGVVLTLYGLVMLSLSTVRWRSRPLPLLVLVALLPSQLGTAVQSWGISLYVHSTEEKILVERESPYHAWAVADLTTGRHQTFRILKSLASPDVYMGAIDRSDARRPSVLPVYHAFGLSWLFKRNIQSIALIGVGAGSCVREILKWFPPAEFPRLHIDVIDIDPIAFQLARDYFDYPARNPRISEFVEDARRFLIDTPGRYDLVIADAYSYRDIPEHLVTREYFELIRSRLKPGGVLALNLISAAEEMPDKERLAMSNRVLSPPHQSVLYHSVLKTLQQVFSRSAIASFAMGKLRPEYWERLGRYQRDNILIFAVNGALNPREANLRETIGERFALTSAAGLGLSDYLRCRYFPSLGLDNSEQAPPLSDDFNPIRLVGAWP